MRVLRVFTMILAVVVLIGLVALYFAGMNRGAAWVFGVDTSNYRVEDSGVSADDGVNVKLPGVNVHVDDDTVTVRLPGLGVNVDDDGIKVGIDKLTEDDRAAVAAFFDKMGDWTKNGGASMIGSLIGTSHNWGSRFEGAIPENGMAEFDAGSVSAIKASWIGGKLTVGYHSGSKVEIRQTCPTGSIPEERRLVYRMEGEKLVIREGSEKRIGSSRSTDLAILLPESCTQLETVELTGIATDITMDAAQLTTAKDMEISTVSGEVSLHKPEVGGNLSINTTSGDVALEGVTVAKDLSIDTTSGKIEMNGVAVQRDVDVDTTSGSVCGADITADGLNVDTVSGSINVESAVLRDVDCDSVSGRIRVGTRNTPKEVSMDSTSGAVELAIEGEAEGFTAEYSSVSGSFRCDFDAQQQGKNKVCYGDGAAEFDFNTISGSITIARG